MSCKYVVGSGPMLDIAMAAWREAAPEIELCQVAIDLHAGRAAVEAALDALELKGASAFVAVDAQFLNFHRLELVDALQQRGVSLPPLVSPSALVSAGVAFEDNCWIGPGAIVQHGCRIGRNTVIGAGAILGAGAAVGQSSWIDDGVVVGRNARVGAHVTLGLGAAVNHGVAIADHVVIDKPGRVETDVAAKTFLHASHDGPIVVVG